MSPLSGPRPGPSFPALPTNPGGLEPVPQLQALYGMAVLATEFPSFVEVFEAVETGVGAGTYGTSASRGKVASMSAGWTIWSGWAPNDGLRRKLKARHVKDGCTSSSFTSEVTVTPWSSAPLPTLLSFVDPSTGKVATTLVDQNSRPISSDQRFRCRVYRSANLSLTNDTETGVTFDSEEYDLPNNNIHSTSVNTDRITVPTGGNTGVWFIRAQLQFAANATGQRYGLLNYFDGSVTRPLSLQVLPAANWAIGGGFNLETTITLTAMVHAPAVGNYWTLAARQNSGGALNLNKDFNLGGAVFATYGTYIEAFHLF